MGQTTTYWPTNQLTKQSIFSELKSMPYLVNFYSILNYVCQTMKEILITADCMLNTIGFYNQEDTYPKQ